MKDHPLEFIKTRLRQARGALIVIQNDYNDKEHDFTTPAPVMVDALDAIQALLDDADGSLGEFMERGTPC